MYLVPRSLSSLKKKYPEQIWISHSHTPIRTHTSDSCLSYSSTHTHSPFQFEFQSPYWNFLNLNRNSVVTGLICYYFHSLTFRTKRTNERTIMDGIGQFNDSSQAQTSDEIYLKRTERGECPQVGHMCWIYVVICDIFL